MRGGWVGIGLQISIRITRLDCLLRVLCFFDDVLGKLCVVLGPRPLGNLTLSLSNRRMMTSSFGRSFITTGETSPLVTSWEVDNLRSHLAAAQDGQAWLLQGGDCAEMVRWLPIRTDRKQAQGFVADELGNRFWCRCRIIA